MKRWKMHTNVKDTLRGFYIIEEKKTGKGDILKWITQDFSGLKILVSIEKEITYKYSALVKP